MLRIAGVIVGASMLALGGWAAVWVRFEGDDPNLLVTTVPLVVAVIGLGLLVRALRAGSRP
jgi:hypothetical protein